MPKGFIKKWEESLIDGVRTPPKIEKDSQFGPVLKKLTDELKANFDIRDKKVQKILMEAQAAAQQSREENP